MATTTRRRITRLVASTAAPAAALAVGTATPASAMNPAQTTTAGVVNLLGGTSAYSIRNFWAMALPSWGYRYTNPTLKYYAAPRYCGASLLGMNNSYWCRNDWTIYLDKAWNQSLINRYGDFGSGGVLAHEWGHAVDSMMGRTYTGYRDEYHADCLAGMYVRWGYAGGRLTGSDYYEFYNWLYGQPYSASHGTGTIRAAWYEFGYQQYSLAQCNRVYTGKAAKAPASAGTVVGTSAGPSTGLLAKQSLTPPTGARVVRAGELPARAAAGPATTPPVAATPAG